VIYLVESIDVAEPDADAYLAALEQEYLPLARGWGLELVSCWRTPGGLGEDVTVTTTFRVRDWAEWEEIRGRSVLDPANAAWVVRRNAFMRRGTRRFHEPAPWSPM
jgi:hypothetical protein